MGKWRKRWRGRSIQTKKQGGIKVEKKGKIQHEDDEKGEFGGEGDDERHNRTKDDNYEISIQGLKKN